MLSSLDTGNREVVPNFWIELREDLGAQKQYQAIAFEAL